MFGKDTLKGKIALVTGGGSGIGFAISEAFLKAGAMVYITSRNEERLSKAVSSLQKHGDCQYIVADIRDIESISKMADSIEQASGKLDILVNNAGGQFPSPASKISPNGWNAVINNNLNGTWYMTHEMANRFFIPAKNGLILNIIANVFRGFPGMVHTGAARAGVDNMTKSLAVEWARTGIRVNAIAPGIIETEALSQYPPEFIGGVDESIPMKRKGKPEDVAQLSLFLVSPFASYITGETIYVDGGMRLWGDLWKM